MAYKKDRVATIIKRSISEMLMTELNDPNLGFPTITDVEVTNDLSFAKVYVMFLQHPEKGLETLQKAKGRIRSYVSKNLSTRRTPELIFLEDTSLETGNRIEKIIEEIKSKN